MDTVHVNGHSPGVPWPCVQRGPFVSTVAKSYFQAAPMLWLKKPCHGQRSSALHSKCASRHPPEAGRARALCSPPTQAERMRFQPGGPGCTAPPRAGHTSLLQGHQTGFRVFPAMQQQKVFLKKSLRTSSRPNRLAAAADLLLSRVLPPQESLSQRCLQ